MVLHPVGHVPAGQTPLLMGHAGAGVKRSHQGTSREWPENTVCAFRRAEQLGLRAVECDATTTRDCQSVVLHHNFSVRFLPRSDESYREGHTYMLDHSREFFSAPSLSLSFGGEPE